jgi:hypothetical protein
MEDSEDKLETVSVTIEDMAGKKFRASLPYEIPISRLLPLLIIRMGLSQTNATGRRISYRLLYVESGAQLRDSETLKQANIQPDHTLKLLADLYKSIENHKTIEYQNISLLIENIAGQKFKIVLSNHVQISQLLPQFIRKLGLSETTSSGKKVNYRLLHLESGDFLPGTITFANADVQDGDTLKIISDLVAGGSWFITTPNILDRVALRFFREAGLFSLFDPESGVYSSSIEKEEMEDMHWFRVYRTITEDKTTVEYAEVFCISPFKRLSPILRHRLHETSWQAIINQYGNKLALTPTSFEQITQRILARSSEPINFVTSDKCFLCIPFFPFEGIHQLSRQFDFASEKITLIPLDVVTLETALAHSNSSKVLSEAIDNWTRRTNRYFRNEPVSGSDFYRRDDNIEEEIRGYIEQGQAFGLFGLRRMGKTSIIGEMNRKQAFGQACVSVQNLQAYLNHSSIWFVLRNAIQEWIAFLFTMVSKAQQKQLSQMRQRLSSENPEPNQLRQYIQRIFSMLPEGMRLILILDEINELLPNISDHQKTYFADWREFLALLRDLQDQSRNRFLLGVSSYTNAMIYEHFGDQGRNPWWQRMKPISVRPLTLTDCNRMIQDIGAMAGLYYTPEALSSIYKLTHGHPQITREFCDFLYKHQVKSIPRTIEVDEIVQAANKYIFHESTIRSLLSSLDQNDQEVVLDLTQKGETKIADLWGSLQSANLNRADFESTLERMIQHGFIQLDDANSAVHLSFGFFETYLKNTALR